MVELLPMYLMTAVALTSLADFRQNISKVDNHRRSATHHCLHYVSTHIGHVELIATRFGYFDGGLPLASFEPPLPHRVPKAAVSRDGRAISKTAASCKVE